MTKLANMLSKKAEITTITKLWSLPWAGEIRNENTERNRTFFFSILISYYRIQHLSLKVLVPRSIKDVSTQKGKSKNVLGKKPWSPCKFKQNYCSCCIKAKLFSSCFLEIDCLTFKQSALEIWQEKYGIDTMRCDKNPTVLWLKDVFFLL